MATPVKLKTRASTGGSGIMNNDSGIMNDEQGPSNVEGRYYSKAVTNGW
jgi:hypothetical protein